MNEGSRHGSAPHETTNGARLPRDGISEKATQSRLYTIDPGLALADSRRLSTWLCSAGRETGHSRASQTDAKRTRVENREMAFPHSPCRSGGKWDRGRAGHLHQTHRCAESRRQLRADVNRRCRRRRCDWDAVYPDERAQRPRNSQAQKRAP